MEKEVELLKDWPPYSPDLNLIEHICFHLEKRDHGYYPHLVDDWRGPGVLKPLMEEACIHCWELIPDYLFERLMEGMPGGIEAVIKARGWYTKY